jgi:hypothetical protein
MKTKCSNESKGRPQSASTAWVQRCRKLLPAIGLLAALAAPAADCLPPPDGLVGWWPGDGNANDIMGANHGGMSNGVAFTAGKVGQGFDLDGVDDYVVLAPDERLLPGTNSFTLTAWIATTNEGKILSGYEGSGGAYGNSAIEFSVENGRLAIWIRDRTAAGPGGPPHWNGQLVTGTTLVTDGDYHLVAVQRDQGAARLRLFVDGVVDADVALNSGAAGGIQDTDSEPDRLLLGAGLPWASFQPTGFLKAKIDEVAICHRALTTNEMAAHHAAGTAGMCKPGQVPPSIGLDPQDQLVVVGQAASFEVMAAGSPPLLYQWQFEGADLSDATNSTLALSSVQTNQAGGYRVIITNLFGAATSQVARLTVLPTPSAVVWTGSGDGTIWSDRFNWSRDTLPANTNDVFIHVPGSVVIRHSGALETTIRSVQCTGALWLQDGSSLTVTTGTSILSGPLTLSFNTRLKASGAGATLVAEGPTSVGDWVQLHAYYGGRLSLPRLTAFASSFAGENLEAYGSGSVLDLPGLVSPVNWGEGTGSLQVSAGAGGTIRLNALPSLSGRVSVQVEGVGSTLECALLTALDVAFNVLRVSEGSLRLPQLATMRGGLTVQAGGVIEAPQLASLQAGTVQVSGSTVSLPGLTNANSSRFSVSAAGVLHLPALHRYAVEEYYNNIPPTFEASGVGSLLDVPLLSSLTPPALANSRMYLSALSGGVLGLNSLSNLSAIGTVGVTVDGTGSRLVATNLARLAGSNLTLTVANAGRIELYSGTCLVEQATNTVLAGATMECGTLDLRSGGTLAGDGTLLGNVINAGVVRTVGNASGLAVRGNYQQLANGILTVGSTGTTAGSGFCPLVVRSNVALAGALALSATFPSRLGDAFVVLSNEGAAPISGRFANAPTGQIIGSPNLAFVIFYEGGDGNDLMAMRPLVSLTRQAGGVVRLNAAAHDYFSSYFLTLSSGQRRLTGVGGSSLPLRIEASTDLVQWQSVANLTSDAEGLCEFLVNDAPQVPWQFFRVRQP